MQGLAETILKVNRDKLNAADPVVVAMATVSIFDVIQQQRPEVRALALAAALSIGTKHMGIEPQDVMTACANLRQGAEDLGRVEFDALVAYLNKHWKEIVA